MLLLSSIPPTLPPQNPISSTIPPTPTSAASSLAAGRRHPKPKHLPIRACSDSTLTKHAFPAHHTGTSHPPDMDAMTSFLEACASSLDESAGKQAHGRILKLGLGSDDGVGGVLVRFYRSCGLLGCAWKVFDEMCERSDQERVCSRLDANCIPKETDGKENQPQTCAPLVSALKTAAEDNAASFHFPGHNRGQTAPYQLTQLIGTLPFAYDLPELPELDNLFAPEGPILEAQKRAAEVFGASETWFLTGSTTCGIQAAIMATCCPGDTLVLPRNCHVSAVNGMVLGGVTPKYVVPEYDREWEIAAPVTPSQANLYCQLIKDFSRPCLARLAENAIEVLKDDEVGEAIKDLELEGRKPAAVLVVSPTYHGTCSDLKGISTLCNSKNIPLIVDEAHGAHFPFHPNLPPSALHQGADLAVQSTHKVLSSLTQSSMLHISRTSLVDPHRISKSLQILHSTSPSYLLLASLDAATAQIAENPNLLENAIRLAKEAKKLIKEIPGLRILERDPTIEWIDFDPLRLTVGVWELGLTGFDADEFLHENHGVMSELVGSRSITFVFTPGSRGDHVRRLVRGFRDLSGSFGLNLGMKMEGLGSEVIRCGEMRIGPREAFFARKRRVGVEESVGKVAGEMICPYPPGIPVMFPGEVITERGIEYIMEVKRQGRVITGASDPHLLSILVCDS